MAARVCLVTGSSSGIGAAVVRHFAANGYAVVVHYHSGEDRAARLADELHRQHGAEVLAVGADLAEAGAPGLLVGQAHRHFGRLDVVVSNSGVTSIVPDAQGRPRRYRFPDTPPDHLEAELERVLDLNLLGGYRLAQAALSCMIEQAQQERSAGEEAGHRSILFVTSISDTAPDSTRIPYGVSKAALSHVVLGAALEGGPYNVTVNALRPGIVDTPMTSRPSGVVDPDSGRELTVAETYALMADGGSQPIRRIGRPEDMAQAAYAFARLSFMTGQLIAVDGGFTLASGFENRELFLREGLRRRTSQKD